MDGKMEPSKTEDSKDQVLAASTSRGVEPREMEPTIYIKQEMPDDDETEAMGNTCIDASDVLVKLEADDEIKHELDDPNSVMKPGEFHVKIEVESLDEKKPIKLEPKKRKPRSGSIATDKDEFINANIIQVTITDDERKEEHKLSLAKRNHFRFKCETCACGFVARKAYDKHMVLHSEVSGDYQCAICFIHLRSPVLHYQHRLRHFRRYKCALCSELGPLKEKEAIASHIRQKHVHTGFRCRQCNKIFKRAKYLKLHEDQIHNRLIEHPCPVCNKVYYQRSNLRIHVRTHDEDVRERGDTFICSDCNAQFTLKCSLRRHMKTAHTEQVAMECDDCHKWYKNREVLKRHRKRDHNKVVMDKELCNICNKYFATPTLLRFHIRRMHMEEGKRFECDYCKKRFMTKGEIRDHIDTVHLGIKDKLCNECGKGFTTNFLLNRHKFIHTGNKFPCNYCDSTFCSSQYVEFHYKLKHLNMTREEIRNQRKSRLQKITDYSDISSTIVKKFHVLTKPEGPEILGN